ncbi:reverse transcriptase domain-containing protein [Tanacetum coccineum]
MTTPVEKRNASKFCEFHGEVGHTTDECMHLKRQIEEMLKAGKLSHLIKELKQNTRKDQAKTVKKGETSGKDKSLAILMVQAWQRVARQRITQTFSPESVISFPSLGEEDGMEGPMIIEAETGGHCVHHMYVDGGSSLEILYEHCFNRFRPEVKNQMVPAATPLIGFSGEIIWPLGQISLLVKIGDEEHSTSAWMDFMVVRSPSPYNGIIGRPGVRKIRAIPSTTHGMLKFLIVGGIVTLRSSRIIPLECSMVSEPGMSRPVINQVTEEKIQVAIHLEYPEQTKPTDTIGVPWHIAKHRLNIREGCLPVRQKKRGQAPKRNKAICEEVAKLVDVGIMKEVHYHSWLSNPVMVKKHDDSWRMCVDFKDLNKECLKDGYPLPEIDWKLESLCGYPFKCFLDAYKGYHQIKMAEEDEDKTTFITSQGIFCYSKMSFGLKNAGATYQRLVDKAFQKQIGRNLEVYVDDLVIKCRTEKEVIRYIEETFRTLREINMKLNQKKCAFGMREGTFLGYKVHADGLRVCPDKVEAVLNLSSPRCLKDVQKLNGKLASLNRFLSKSAEKSLPFFKTLKKCTKKSDFQWTAEAEIAFKQMKQSIAELKEELIMYLAAAKEAISAVLITERDGKQVPIYFVSHALQGPEINYTPMEKINTCFVQTENSVKGQILADFIVERSEDDILDTPMEEGETLPDPWVLFRDRSSCVDGSRAGLIITNPEGMEFTYALRFRFDATNNEAKYEALIAGLSIAGFAHLRKQVLVEELREKSIDEKDVLAVIEEEGHTWMTPVHEYLTEGILPEEKKKERAVGRKAKRYAVINETLYKKSFLGPWLRCVGPLQANYILREIHEGSCRMHSGPRSVVAKALRSGYYWPTMHTDARNLIRECSDCRVHRPVPRNPHEKLTPITSPWPFYKWGIDIAGPFSEGPGKVKFLIVAMDYFTKWIEEKPMVTITGAQVKKFVWDNMVCRFGLPGEIVSDNGKQFRDNPFKDQCEKLNIRQCFAFMKHPQANGLVERANRSLREGIKARLGEENKNWVEEISHVLWAYRTMIKSSNGETPFSLTYGAESVIPVEIGMPTLRTTEVDMIKNNEDLGINLDLLEEKREQAAIQEARSKAKTEKYYNARVRSTSFRPGDLVYWNNKESHAKDGGKLGPKWEGPYEVTEALGRGAYKLRDRNGNILPRTWNICNLKKCYVHEM